MLKSYFITALRIITANKVFGLINIFGLAIGLTAFILISMFINYELDYDKHYQNGDDIYRVERSFLSGGVPNFELATSAPNVGPLIAQDFNDIESSTRIVREALSVAIDDLSLYEEHLFAADKNFFEFFGFEFISGSQTKALHNPTALVISESTAERYFGNSDPIGKTVLLGGKYPVSVTGVFKDLPKNTHLRINAITNIQLVLDMFGADALERWGSNSFYTYIKVAPGTNVQALEEQFPSFLQRHIGENAPEWTSLTLRKLDDIHLYSNKELEMSVNGSISSVITFTAIALSILTIACINFMNLSTARSIMRAKEIGVRKTMGATRYNLIIQFLCESILLTAIAVVIALAAIGLILPAFSSIVQRELVFADFANVSGVLFIVACTLVVGLVAGSYPAFYLSKFNVVEVLNGQTKGSKSANLARKILVTFQFSISVVLIISTLIVFAQMRYISSKDLGYVEDNILISTLPLTDDMFQLYLPLKNKLENSNNIESITISSFVPSSDLLDGSSYISADVPMSRENSRSMRDVGVDYGFFELYDINLIAGRLFSEDFNDRAVIRTSDENPHGSGNIIINEEALKAFGFSNAEEAINKIIIQPLAPERASTMRWTIIGVVEDVYFSSLKVSKRPIVYSPIRPNATPMMSIKYKTDSIASVVTDVTLAMREIAPEFAVVNEFLEDRLKALYKDEEIQSILFTTFSLLTIVVTLLGLYGLVSFATERRSKEIAIRKVLGAKVSNIVTLMSKDFTLLIITGNILAWPIGYIFMSKWLDEFMYATPMSAMHFILASLIVSVIAFSTIVLRTAITASSKPVKALRTE